MHVVVVIVAIVIYAVIAAIQSMVLLPMFGLSMMGAHYAGA